MESTSSSNDINQKQTKAIQDQINSDTALKKDMSINGFPNPILGSIDNLLYLKDGNNLAAAVVKDSSSGNACIFAADPNIAPNFNPVKVKNLSAFQSRLEEAINFNNLISIRYEKGNITSLVVVNRTPDSSTRGGGPVCCIPFHCPPC